MNDIHKAAGAHASDKPDNFLRNRKTGLLIQEIKQFSHLRSEPVVSINGGDGRGSYACEELVYSYAMWISPKFHLEVIHAYDRLATNGVAVHRNAAEDLLANPLKYFEAVFNEAKKLAEENTRLEAEKLGTVPD